MDLPGHFLPSVNYQAYTPGELGKASAAPLCAHTTCNTSPVSDFRSGLLMASLLLVRGSEVESY